jgi:hypothetical protein
MAKDKTTKRKDGNKNFALYTLTRSLVNVVHLFMAAKNI